MSYNRTERRIAALLDSAPGLRSWVKAGYQRANYLLHGGRSQAMRLHPQAAIELIAGGERANRDRGSPQECFYGYFGLQPWSRDGRHYLYHRWRSPSERTVEICVHDRDTGAATRLAESRAWNFQQGCMAQWLYIDGVESTVFNDAIDRRLICRIIAPSRRERAVEWPIQALRPGEAEALSLNYRRLARIRRVGGQLRSGPAAR